MRKINTIIAVGILVLMAGMSFAVKAQTAEKGRSKADLEAKINNFKHRKRYEVTYDKFQDNTLVVARNFEIKAGITSSIHYRRLSCSAGFEFEGETLKGSPEAFMLVIEIFTGGVNKMFSDDPQLILLIDNERVDLGKGKHKVDLKQSAFSSSLRSVEESIYFGVDPKKFEKIAKATLIEFQIGGVEFKFGPKTLEMFKNVFELGSLKSL